jgi:hypothetical protein
MDLYTSSSSTNGIQDRISRETYVTAAASHSIIATSTTDARYASGGAYALNLLNSATDSGTHTTARPVPPRSRSLSMAISDLLYQVLAFVVSLFSLLFR